MPGKVLPKPSGPEPVAGFDVICAHSVGSNGAPDVLPFSIAMPGFGCAGAATVLPVILVRSVPLELKCTTLMPAPLVLETVLSAIVAFTSGVATIVPPTSRELALALMPTLPSTLPGETKLSSTMKSAFAVPEAPTAMPSPRMLRTGETAVPLFAIRTLPSAIPVTLAVTPNTPILLVASPRISLLVTSTRLAVSGLPNVVRGATVLVICSPTSSTPLPLGKLTIELLLIAACVSPAAVVGVPSMWNDTPSCLDVAGLVVLWNALLETVACEIVPEALRTFTPPPYGLVTVLPVTVS